MLITEVKDKTGRSRKLKTAWQREQVAGSWWEWWCFWGGVEPRPGAVSGAMQELGASHTTRLHWCATGSRK